MNTEPRNHLAQAASAYLRSARNQPVAWHEWNEEAFAQAQREDKPVLLDIGATWCHWCHVMDRESYEDPNTAALINEFFLAVKVDRDERPDVDARYQAAVSAISGQAGWPLTAFLTPDGKPYFGGSYFPPEERYGRPSFAHVLRSMAHAYRSQRAEVEESANSVVEAIEQSESFSEQGPALNQALLDTILHSILSQFDSRHGGFGSQPKFLHPSALDLLLDAAARPGPMATQAREVVKLTLSRMARGGVHDQLAGGFHRYSTDERWVVPHFEKMAYDNSELLRVYAHAHQNFADEGYGVVAEKILGWMGTWLADSEQGGFYASQDADAFLDDDGGYYTWTRTEAKAALTPDEFAVAERYYHLRPVGHMHHNPAKNVLHVIGDLPEIAAALAITEHEAVDLLTSAQKRLLTTRLQRRAPFIDRTIYTGWNGLCISAYLAAGQALKRADATEFALKSLERVLGAWHDQAGLKRVVAYGDGGEPVSPVPAMLDDYVFLGTAALDAWEMSGETRYFEAAERVAEALLEEFSDPLHGGFFDVARKQRMRPIGALAAHRKPVQDAPTPAGNPVAATLLLRLYSLTGVELYRQKAEKTLAMFSGVAEHLGLYAASYGHALRRTISPSQTIVIVGNDEVAEALATVASSSFLVGKDVIRMRQKDRLADLPFALREGSAGSETGDQGSFALVCADSRCMFPVYDCAALLTLLNGL